MVLIVSDDLRLFYCAMCHGAASKIPTWVHVRNKYNWIQRQTNYRWMVHQTSESSLAISNNASKNFSCKIVVDIVEGFRPCYKDNINLTWLCFASNGDIMYDRTNSLHSRLRSVIGRTNLTSHYNRTASSWCRRPKVPSFRTHSTGTIQSIQQTHCCWETDKRCPGWYRPFNLIIGVPVYHCSTTSQLRYSFLTICLCQAFTSSVWSVWLLVTIIGKRVRNQQRHWR